MTNFRKYLSSLTMPKLSYLCVLIVLIAFPIRAQCSEPPIIVGKTQMTCGGSQVLSIWNYQTGNTYTWSIQSGGGSLSASSGERVTYTAPDSNPDCANNPTIVVSRNGEAVGSIVISVNCHTGSEDERAYICYSDFLSGKAHACCAWNADEAVCVRGDAYNCLGAKIEVGHYGCVHFASCRKTITHLGIKWNCVNHDGAGTLYDSYPECISSCILYYTAPNTCTDIRTEQLKQQGCCPHVPPPPPPPGDGDLGGGECSAASVGNPVTVYNGNKTESEEDLKFASPHRPGFFLRRFYNSQSEGTRPLGYGWTHNYNVHLYPSFIFEGDTYLRIIDETGRGLYFEEAGSGHYVGAFKERTIVEVGAGNYVWYRLDNSRFVFNAQGNLIWIQDEVGNRQILTYGANNRVETVDDEASGRIHTFHYNADDRIMYITGPVTPAVPDGVWVSYGYDANHNLISVTYADGSGFDYVYGDPSDVNNLTEKHDKAGHLLSTWTYDAQDRVFENYTRDGRGVTINYVNENKVLVTDAYGVTRTYSIFDIGGRKRVTHIDGPAECPGCGQDVVRLEYDSAMRIIEVEYANGLINQNNDFDSRGNAQTVVEAVGTADERTITYTFHPDIYAKLSQTEPSLLGAGNKVTIWDYDDDGNTTPNENPTRLLHRKIEQGITKEISGSVTAYEYITTYTYNSKGQVLTIDGPEPGTQDTTTFTYDSTTRDLLTVTRRVVGITTYSQYGADGQPGRVTDANGNALTYTYDGRGRIATTTNEADGSTTTYDYNNAGELDTVTQPNGVTSDFVYDGTYGRLTRVVDPLGNYIQYGYDNQGNRTELSHFDPQDQHLFWKRFDFQGSTHPGRLWKEINPDDTYTEYTYDAGGNIGSVTDAAGKVTSYDYDLFARLTTVTQPGSVITGYAYDQQNNLATVADAESHVTTYVYDDLGRLVTTTSPDTGTTAYAYDASGNLIAKTDANGQTVTYTYDALNRLTGLHFPDPAQDITYTYDQGTNGKGRLTGMTDPNGTYTYSYDALGNLITEEKTIDTVTYTTQYAYDAAGILTGITYPDGRTVTYEFDSAARVNRVTTTKESVTSTLAENITYLPFGPLQGLTYGNGTALTKTFDQLYRLTSLGAGSIQSLGYTLDPVGSITAIADNLDPARSQTFGYDDLYRLTSATGVYGTMGYTYDKVGNRLTNTAGSQTDTYTYEAGTNRIAQVTGANPQTFSYDANGNTTAMGFRSLTYNQNNRLIQMAENSTTLGTYTYNGNGQRVKKAAEETTIYHYDRFGNLIGESTQSGDFLADYVYLNNMRLAAIAGEVPQEITVSVITDKGALLSGLRVYAFTESGSYTGKYATTDENGVARFDLSDFSDGTYEFRADYLSYQFWSDVITVPGTYSTTIQIAEETTTVSVTQGGVPKQGVKVYLFNAGGSYLGLYETTDENGEVSFDLPAGKDFKFRADNLGSQFFSETITIVSGGPNDYDIDSGGGTLSVTVDKGEGTPISGIKVYLFKAGGSYLGLWDQTDASGLASFEVCSGDYKVRADYLGYQFWSEEIIVSSDANSVLSIPHQDVIITVEGDNNGDVEPRENLKVYLFTASGSYLGTYQVTDTQGQVTFNLPAQDYKVRADYLSQQYWSQVVNWTDDVITINEGMADVTVTNMGLPVEGVNVYCFNSSGSYLGIYDTTDPNGETSFRLPAGDYSFRADYMGNQYWSGMATLIAHVSNPVEISTGGGSFTLTVLKGLDDPMAGVKCYLFNDSGSYLGEYGVTNDQGEVAFNLADGSCKIRVDYLGYQYWTEVFDVPASLSLTHTIFHQDVTITVNGDYAGDVQPFQGLKVYLFTPSGSYLGKYEVTDAQGQVTFNLPEQDYKVRADYLSQQYWSEVFNAIDETITINEGMAEVHVTQGATPLEYVKVYVFNASGSYLSIYGQTDAQGIVDFRLPEGTYKFRADHQSSQYWATEPVNAHQVNVVNLETGGGTFVLTVGKEAGMPMTNIPVYVFSAGGSYLSMSAQTDAQGQVTFDLSDGDYKFRADYLGYQFWSDISTVPTTLSDVLAIPYQDVRITVERLYQAPAEPLEGVRVYLFKESGSYMGLYANTNAQGQVTFSLPQESYKVRADYMGYQFWSEPFVWTDTYVTIDHGLAVIHVTQGGADVVDAPVYLFKASGSYLGRYERIDSAGMAEFLLPDQEYKFRVDYDGTQYWSDVVTIIPHEANNIELNLDLLALDLTNDPNPVRFDGVPPKVEPERVLVASLGSLTGLFVQSIISQTSGENIYYYVNDHLGTPQKMMDHSGAVVWAADYKPFGEANITVNTTANNFRFPGQYLDQETGLHYNYYRYYHPGMGRYLRTDPIGLIANLNLYGYADQNPINSFDPRGLYRDVGGGFGLTAGIVGVSASIHTESCCDDQGRKHVRTVQTVCVGLELGLGLKGGSHAAISDVKKPGKCPKMYDESGYYSEQQGVWGALVVGREYSITEKSGGWKFGFGGGWTIYSGCRNDVLKDVTVGKCCDQ